ncbi:MAG: efflux RND transporter periplasmic adaptor subunit [Flavobacteriales bacterium]|nr:efflux RND transporter periplasmic adaptor subunit [Flavobacteriales bacterium]
MSAAPSFAQDATSPPPRPAKLIDIIAQDPVSVLTLPTIVEPSVTVNLTMLVGGILNELPVWEGQTVKKGDLIAQIDTVTLQNGVDQAQSQFDTAEIEYQRAEQLIQSQAIAQTTVDQRKSARDIARLAHEAAQKQLSDATLTAPFDGIIAQIPVRRYQTISPQVLVAVLQNATEFEAAVNIPAQSIANSADVQTEDIFVVLDVDPLRPIPATFKSISTQPDPASQTYEVKFSFTPPEGVAILSGMTGELQATIRQTGAAAKALAIQIPVSAILYDGTDTFVWVVNTDTMSVSKTKVTLADAIGAMLPVIEGLKIGDTIVGAGASYLFEGMIIRRFEG